MVPRSAPSYRSLFCLEGLVFGRRRVFGGFDDISVDDVVLRGIGGAVQRLPHAGFVLSCLCGRQGLRRRCPARAQGHGGDVLNAQGRTALARDDDARLLQHLQSVGVFLLHAPVMRKEPQPRPVADDEKSRRTADYPRYVGDEDGTDGPDGCVEEKERPAHGEKAEQDDDDRRVAHDGVEALDPFGQDAVDVAAGGLRAGRGRAAESAREIGARKMQQKQKANRREHGCYEPADPGELRHLRPAGRDGRRMDDPVEKGHRADDDLKEKNGDEVVDDDFAILPVVPVLAQGTAAVFAGAASRVRLCFSHGGIL